MNNATKQINILSFEIWGGGEIPYTVWTYICICKIVNLGHVYGYTNTYRRLDQRYDRLNQWRQSISTAIELFSFLIAGAQPTQLNN